MAKNNNKSMFLYTALIFIVAILLIILSFFGQTNLEKKQPKIEEEQQADQTQSGITERAALLSEENKNLIEENTRLKEENEGLLEQQTENNLLLAANGYLSFGNNAKALELLLSVDYDKLSSDQQIIYDNIKNTLDAAE